MLHAEEGGSLRGELWGDLSPWPGNGLFLSRRYVVMSSDGLLHDDVKTPDNGERPRGRKAEQRVIELSCGVVWTGRGTRNVSYRRGSRWFAAREFDDSHGV